MGLPTRVREMGQSVGPAIEAYLARIRDGRLGDAAGHLPRAGGKRLRPALAMLAAEAAGGEPDDAKALAVAIELLHNFSLVHDDLMDEDEKRRGVDTVHVKWDTATAILAGDGLFALVFEALGTLPPERGMPVVADVAATARVLCEGQISDMAFERRWPTPDEYWTMIRGKTARLFQCATENGARLGGADDATREALAAYGDHMGLAFQVQDDLLDMLEAEGVTGKPRGSDLRAGKKTLPVLIAHARGDATARSKIEAAVGNAKLRGAALDETIALLESTGAIETCKQRVLDEFTAARDALKSIPDSAARSDLMGVLDALQVRRA